MIFYSNVASLSLVKFNGCLKVEWSVLPGDTNAEDSLMIITNINNWLTIKILIYKSKAYNIRVVFIYYYRSIKFKN